MKSLELTTGLSEAVGQCSKHGEYTAMVLPFMANAAPICPLCTVEDAKQQSLNDNMQGSAERYHQQRRKNIGAPPRLMAQSFETYQPENATASQYLKACKAYAENWEHTANAGANISMVGKTGTGKSHLATAICQVVAKHGAQPIYTTASNLIRYIRGSYARNAEYSEPQAFARFAACDLLVIDEIGVKESTEHDRATLFEVIDERNQHMLPTIIISNLNMQEIEEQTDVRFVDRMSQNGTLMDFTWDSYRSQA